MLSENQDLWHLINELTSSTELRKLNEGSGLKRLNFYSASGATVTGVT